MGALSAAEMTIIGAFSPTVRSSTWLSITLAVEEINSFIGSTPSAAPVLAVLCSGAEDDLPVSMAHLVDALGVRAILGSVDDASVRLALTSPATRESALFLSPGSAPVAPLAPMPLSWHLGGLQRDVAAAYPALVERELARTRAMGSVEPKVLSVVAAAPEDTALADLVEATLVVDGHDVRSASALDRYRRLDLVDDDPDAREQALRVAATYAPDVVLAFLGGDFRVPEGLERGSFVAALDGALNGAPDAGNGSPSSYILAPHARDDRALRRLARTSPPFRARAVGLDARRPPERALLDAAIERFDDAFPRAGEDLATARLSDPVYDALYLLFYARVAAGRATEAVVSPAIDSQAAALGDALQRIGSPGGAPVAVGPGAAGLDTGIPLLLAGDPIDVVTTSGPAHFDGVVRARPADARIWCWSDAGTPEDGLGLDDVLANPAIELAPCTPGIDAP